MVPAAVMTLLSQIGTFGRPSHRGCYVSVQFPVSVELALMHSGHIH
jgi:hypothetical protein